MLDITSNPQFHGFWGTTEVFANAGYKIINLISSNCEEDSLPCDFMAKKNEKTYAIEVMKYGEMQAHRPSVRWAAQSLTRFAASQLNYIPVLVLLNVISPRFRKDLLEQYPDLIVLDICNLLYMVQSNEGLRNRLVSELNFSVDKLVPKKPTLDLSLQSASQSIWDVYIQKLRGWKPPEEKNSEYENLCSDILKNLFADDLTDFRLQHNTNAGLFRIDMIAKIKRGNNKEFWEMAERYFSTKYIVFEYKNYSGTITQTQVFTTEKYLYAKALRSIAILIAANGADDHAKVAIRGILREEGKLIIVLSNDDLIKMLEMKQQMKNPADYLSKELDNLLCDLEK